MTRRRWTWLLVALVLALAAVQGLRGLQARKAQAAAAVAAAKAETVVELAAGDVLKAAPVELAQGLPVSGSLRAVNSAFVKARIPGELQGLTVREGDSVKAGQVLARIDPLESRARMRQAEEQADAAKAQVDIAQRTYDNNKALVDQGFISRTALDTSQASLNAARSSYRAALAAVDMVRKGLDDTVLQAPISGVVAQRLAQPGERVAVDGKVVEIVDLSRLELEATLGAADSVQLRVGQQAQLQVEGMARPVAARVVRINPSAQAGSRSVLAYLALDDATGLRQGLFAQGQVTTGRASGLAVPLAAIRTDKPAPYLQLVDNGRVVHRPVAPGPRGAAGNETWVGVDGVPAGTLVVKGHVGPLREGTAVRFTGEAARPPAPAASGARAG
ncbi:MULTISPECIES: efflux RND transporter periplasmic adaptor subunit [Ramlibacter]|uniref:Efflux RND transporter periplasmic adaptor subunit n=1 Tax=Ramlibacter pinisoli TaxID=2682844 RepID=A0A6N8IRK0_9BURK|nr:MULTISPECIES: efflux RND transporter periplasmic adaptor subunit [Ramlibacter]MBA2964498.1 efflux RND transporter periplasmic adaptor subunit [Ramlibacter sp. CGMCC 1.13660]MVQ29464.1 efflux RND transporter periplasmic adaptor subunit [Ramlibacter pinisoli]